MSYDDLRRKLSDLYHLRNNYFDVHPISDASLKDERIKAKIEEIVNDVNLARAQLASGGGIGSGDAPKVDNLANLCWIEGKARNAAAAFDPTCQEMLTKALKLNPLLGDTTDLYVQLGECLWKKKPVDKEGAKLSFEQCLKSSDKEIVKLGKRNLSIVLRQIAAADGTDHEQKAALEEKSVELAKEAIQLDFRDGYSWYILGNAHFSQFFCEGQKWEVMKQALQAYKNAFKDASSKFNCDLHFNQAMLFKFQEKYQQALNSFQFALQLDPVWEEAKKECTHLETLLFQMNDMISNNGGLKKKQFDKIVSKFDNSQLGPFLSPFKHPKSDISIQLTKCPLDDLKTIAASEESLDFRCSLNDDKVCLLKVVAEVGTDSTRPPYHCIAVDEKKCLCALSVFNAADTFHLQRSDSVAIAQPFVTTHDFSFHPATHHGSEQVTSDKSLNSSEVTVSFRLIRVNTPADLVVNGRKASRNLEAFVSIGVQAKAC